MARVTAEQFQEKHARRLKAAVEDIRAGVERVTEAPTKKAAAKVDKMRMNLMKSLDDGKWQRGLERVSLEEWKNKMINKGINRVSVGIDEAAEKVKNFASELLPHIDAGVNKVKRMPDTTLDDNINRMVTMTRHMATFKRTK